MANLSLHIRVLVSCASLLIIGCHAHPQPSQKHAALFILGDSVFDPGNNNYINTTGASANYGPYGMTFFKHPTGRFSDGRLISDFIASFANLPPIRPYLEPGFNNYYHGVNFASAGAGALVESNTFVINMKTQLNYFKKVKIQLTQKLGNTKAEKLLSNSIYLISLGGNDYFAPYFRNTTNFQSYTHEEYVGMVIGNITDYIKEIYILGGRKFGFQNMELIGCTPVVKALISRSDNCLEELNTLAKLHNKAFYAALQKLEDSLQGFKYSIFDSHTFYRERMNKPSKYGYKDGKGACCGSGPYRGFPSCGGRGEIKEYELCENPNEYLYFDFAHLTDMANQQLAKLMWDGPSSFTGPYNLEALFKME